MRITLQPPDTHRNVRRKRQSFLFLVKYSFNRALFICSVYLLFDELPYDASHLISVHLHHRLVHLDAPRGI